MKKRKSLDLYLKNDSNRTLILEKNQYIGIFIYNEVFVSCVKKKKKRIKTPKLARNYKRLQNHGLLHFYTFILKSIKSLILFLLLINCRI